MTIEDQHNDDNLDTKLSFAGQQLKLNTKEDGEKVAEKIRDCVILDTLELRGNTLGVEATIPIADALESRPELRHALWSDLFTGRLKEEIPKTLKQLTGAMMSCGARLTELDLSDNAIGPMAMPGLKDFLASESASELKVLNFNNCGLGVAGKTIAQCLMQCHRDSKERGAPLRLRRFIAGRNRLEYISTFELAKAFKQIGTLEEIVMPQNGIRAEGILELAKAVEASPYLKHLNLNDNTFGRKGALAMAKALSDLMILETVDFGDCLCRSAGSVEICRHLTRSGTPLKTLNLSGNEINYNAAKQIIDQTRWMSALEQLKLGLNCYGGQWTELRDDAERRYPFVDMGAESDDEGTGDEEKDDDDENHDSDDNRENSNDYADDSERESS